jgi:H+/Cl- antiporter ClcA
VKPTLERVRKIEQRWKVARWLLLVAGGAMVGFAVWVYRVVLPDGEKLLRLTASEQARLHIQGSEWLVPWLGSKYAFVAARAYVFVVLGFILILWALTQWRGNPTRRAVLELEEELNSRETQKRDAT